MGYPQAYPVWFEQWWSALANRGFDQRVCLSMAHPAGMVVILKAGLCAALFGGREMSLWVLAAVQYADYFYCIGSDSVKQDVACNGQASGVGHEFRAFNPHQWLLGKEPEMRFQIFQVTVGLGFPPLPKSTLIDVFQIAFGGRGNN